MKFMSSLMLLWLSMLATGAKAQPPAPGADLPLATIGSTRQFDMT